MNALTVSNLVSVPLVNRQIGLPAQRWRDRFASVLCHSHTYSGRADHGGTIRPPESYRRLVAWARREGIDAIGAGSPYTPVASALYGRYDADARNAYYAPDFDKDSVLRLEAAEAAAMLEQMNSIGGECPLFYLDNETPKGRYGHLWWFGHVADYPAWHDYDQPYDRWMLDDPAALGDADEPVRYERRPYMQIVAAQRRSGALGFWAHPTSWWNGPDGRFITNIATEMPAHAFADGFLDGIVVMGYHPERPEYQGIWFALLDLGVRVAGVAEMDMGLSEETLDRRRPMLNYAPSGRTDVHADLRSALANGQTFSSSGPMIDLRVDGAGPGEVVATRRDVEHMVKITAHPARPGEQLEAVELVGRGGAVIWRGGAGLDGTVTVRVEGEDCRGYLLARAMGSADTAGKPGRRDRYAISNPVYLHPPGSGFRRPGETRLRMRFAATSKAVGGRVRFESATGELLDEHRVRPGVLDAMLPASGRWTLLRPDGTAQTEYLINANAKLLDLQRYLYRGRFLRDFRSAKSGEVPVAAWRLEEHLQAMQDLTVER